jgi:hypothetical protein
MILGQIRDGYNERGYIAEVPRLHPAVRFEFRPMTLAERGLYIKAIGTLKKDNELRTYMAGCIKEHLTGQPPWDLRNDKGEIVPLTVDELLRLKPRLFDRLFMIVSGEEAPDADPEAPPAELDQEALDIQEAVKTGKTIGQIREERDLKNSPKG